VLIDLADGWMGGVDLQAVGGVCDGAILCCYFMEPEAVTALMKTGRAALGGHSRPFGIGVDEEEEEDDDESLAFGACGFLFALPAFFFFFFLPSPPSPPSPPPPPPLPRLSGSFFSSSVSDEAAARRMAAYVRY